MNASAQQENALKPAPDNLVEVSDLHFAFEQNTVLNGITLSIPRGKLVAILGVSGCGKTTLLRHIGGQLRPSRGQVTFDGQAVHKLGSKALYAMRRKMGMMFQVSGLFTDLSVFDNIAYPMREHTDLPE
ncbi:MAG: ATP-binding cassette domain-containing protein, partial [Thiobacillus sp.]|nr:ATP-binding cassette domain-containing protein [Thiobacillus sp.]